MYSVYCLPNTTKMDPAHSAHTHPPALSGNVRPRPDAQLHPNPMFFSKFVPSFNNEFMTCVVLFLKTALSSLSGKARELLLIAVNGGNVGGKWLPILAELSTLA